MADRLQIDTGAGYVTFDNTKLSDVEISAELEDDVRTRTKLSGKVTIYGDEYDTLKTLLDANNFVLAIKIQEYVSAAWQTVATGQILLYGSIDLDRHVGEFTLISEDEYTTIINNWKNEFNLMTVTQSEDITIDLWSDQIFIISDCTTDSQADWRTGNIPSPTLYADCGTIDLEPNHPSGDYSWCWYYILNGQIYYIFSGYTATNLAATWKTANPGSFPALGGVTYFELGGNGDLTGQLEVDAANPRPTNVWLWFDNRFQGNFENTSISARTNLSESGYRAAFPNEFQANTFYQVDISKGTAGNVAACSDDLWTYKKQYYNFDPTNLGVAGYTRQDIVSVFTFTKYPSIWAKASCSHDQIDYELSDRCIKLFDIIETLLDDVDGSVSIDETGANTYANYWKNTDTELSEILFTDKQLISTGTSISNYSTLNRFFEIMRDQYNMYWYLEDVLGTYYLKFKHPSEFDFTSIGLDLTALEGVNWVESSNRYEYDLLSETHKEIWTFADTNIREFKSAYISYTNNFPNKIEISQSRINNNLPDLLSDDTKSSDETFCFISTTYISLDNYDVNNKFNINALQNDVNGKMAIFNLLYDVFSNGNRLYPSGTIDGGISAFTNTKATRKQVEIEFPLNDWLSLDLTQGVETDIGTMIPIFVKRKLGSQKAIIKLKF